MQRILQVALALLSLAEVAILDWAVRLVAVTSPTALGGVSLAPQGLTLGGWAVAWIVVGGANLLIFPAARSRLRARGWPLALSRGWILASIGALASGLLLFFAHLLARGGGLLHPAVGEGVVVAAGGVALATGFGAVAWGYFIGQAGVRIEELTLPLPGLPRELERLRIAHITDLHIGPLLRPPQLRRFVELVNGLGADLVVLTGDIFDMDPADIETGCRELSGLRARHGVYAVLGNHDVYVGAEAVAEGLSRFTSIRLLRNEWVQVEIEEGSLAVVGFEDPGTEWAKKRSRSDALERLAKSVPPELPSLLLIHRPSFFPQAASLGFRLALAGHTHGGQVSLPFAPEHNPARLISHWTRGRVELDGAVLYVNRGLGVAGLPLRLNCPREIALIRLAGDGSSKSAAMSS